MAWAVVSAAPDFRIDIGADRSYADSDRCTAIQRGRIHGMKIAYESPAVVDYGSITAHTFNNPGKGDKSAMPLAPDKFGENSHAFASP